MSDENKLIIYQVFTRLFGHNITTASITAVLPKTDVARWRILPPRH